MSEKPVSDLQGMLAGMQPELHSEAYRFLSVPLEDAKADWIGEPFALIRESEGATIVAAVHDPVEDAPLFARITLMVHSALEGVGLTATVSSALADAGVACNIVAGFYHDHLFVPWDRRLEALSILRQLSKDARR